jgi:hypothetical protein
MLLELVRSSEMMRMAALLACVSVAGCHSWALGFQSGSAAGSGSRPSGSVSRSSAQDAGVSVASGDRVLTGIVVAVLLAEGVRYYLRGDDGTMTPLHYVPQPDPGRTVSEQDCTAPVDPQLGNLLCR